MKVFLCIANSLDCFVVIVEDVVSTDLGNIIENTTYTFLWVFSIMLLRREFVKLGKTTWILLSFYAFMILTPITVLLVDMDSDISISNLRYTLKLISLFLNALLIGFGIIKRTDIGNIYSRSSSAYNQLLKSYFVEDESIEDPEKLWEKWDTLAEETVPIVTRENIKSITITGTKEIEDVLGIIIFYIIEIDYGKTRSLKREVPRRYREFLQVFYDLKTSNPNVQFPDFPAFTKTRSEVTKEVVRQRGQTFNEIFQLIVSEKLHCPSLSKFLNKSPEPEFSEAERKNRIMSTIQETEFTVSINKATREEKKFMTHARYEIVVFCGKKSVTSYHRFSDFKKLHKTLAKRHKNLEELPPNHLTKSSTNPKVVKERKLKLQEFLAGLLNDPFTKSDIDTVRFLNLFDFI